MTRDSVRMAAPAAAAALAALLLAACASEPSSTAETSPPPAEPAAASATDAAAGSSGGLVTELMRRDDARLQTYRIDTWSAPDDRTLIVESIDGTLYRAQMMGSCMGLRFTDTLGFVTRGTNALDDFSGIVLPDGTRCTFQSFERVSPGSRAAEGAAEAPEEPERP